jgi:WD40 repeat protein
MSYRVSILLAALAFPAAAEPGPTPREVRKDPLPDGAVARLGSAGLRHPDAIYSVDYSPDGNWIATAGRDGTARVWDARTGDLRYRFPIPNENGQPRVAFMQDGKALWVLPSRYPRLEQIARYSMSDGKELPKLFPPTERSDVPAVGAGFDPAGRVFAYTEYTANPNSKVTLLDAGTGKPVARFAGRAWWSMEPVLAPGGRVVACPGDSNSKSDGVVRLVRAESGDEVATIETGGPVQATKFSPDGKLVATSSILPRGESKAASLWDTTSGKLVRHLEGRDSARSLAFSPDGRILAVAVSGGNGPVLLFDVAKGQEVRRLASPPTVTEVAFSPDGTRLVASRSIGSVSVWDVATGDPTRPSTEPNLLFLVRFVGADRLLLDVEGAVVYDWRSGRVVERSVTPATARPLDRPRYTASPDRKLVAESHYGPVIRLCDYKTGTEVRRLEGHTEAVAAVRFSEDGSRLYSLGYDRTVREWDVATGKQLRRLDLGEDKVAGTFQISAWERWLAVDFVTPRRPTVRVWDLRTGTEAAPPTLPTEYTQSSVFSQDGTALVIAGGRRSRYLTLSTPEPAWLVVWDLTTRSVRSRLGVPGGAITSAFSTDGRSLITGGFDGTVRIWELTTGTPRRAFPGHDSRVFRVAASPDGRHVASSGADGLTYVWDPYSEVAGGATDLAKLWADLADPQGGKAFAALGWLVARPGEAVAVIRDRLRPAPAAEPERIRDFIQSLDSDRFAVRERAATELRRLGREIEPVVRARLDAGPSAEARERLTGLLKDMPAPTPDDLREWRAVEALERIGTPAAVELLKKWAGDAKLRIAPAARAAAERLGKS